MSVSHLNKLLDIIQRKKLLFPKSSHGLAKRWNDPGSIIRHIENAVCFDTGAMDEMVGRPIVPELMKLPFDTCWFETRIIGEINGVLAFNSPSDPDGFCGLWFSNRNSTWMLIDDFNVRVEGARCSVSSDQKHTDGLVGHIGAFLSALNCCNVSRVEHTPDPVLQKARMRRGKKPLFSCWTLAVDLDSQEQPGQPLGGTHASPRLHLRRGHARQLQPGRWTWVRACMVGNKQLGMVHKDYAVRSPFGPTP